jgi:hypothetical protein
MSSPFGTMGNLGLGMGSININFGIGSGPNGAMATNDGAAGVVPMNNFFSQTNLNNFGGLFNAIQSSPGITSVPSFGPDMMSQSLNSITNTSVQPISFGGNSNNGING